MKDIDHAEYLTAPGVHLGVTPSYQQRFVSRCGAPLKRNLLWERWLAPSLIIDDLNLHVPMHEDKTSNFSHHGSLRARDMLGHSDPPQLAFSLFSNPILQPAFQYDDGMWQRPKERCAVTPFWVFTFEADETALQTQCDWIWSKDANGQAPMDLIDLHLAQNYRDYRGYTVVWSGNKSLHIHFLFANSHLNRRTIEVLARREGKNPEAQLRNHWQCDINQHVIWDYYSARWDHLETIFRQVTGVEDKFDTSLRYLHQKRRLPWGLRVAVANNTQGFNEGDLIPQIVLEERMRKTSAKGALDYFLKAAEANAMLPAQVRKPSSGQGSVELYADELLPALTNYLRAGWGADYPKPAAITEEANGLTVWFYNSPADQTPSSIIEEDYRALLWRGRDAPAGERYKPLPDTSFTLGELLVELQAEVDAKQVRTGSGFNQSGQNSLPPTLRLFSKHLRSTSPQHVRSAMSLLAWDVSHRFARNMIVSAEGGGKTTAAIRDAGRFRLDDMLSNHFGNALVAPATGFQVVAAASYKQAKEHYDAYHAWWKGQTDHASIDFPAPVLLRSFSEMYKQQCADCDRTPISHTEALKMGFNSLVEAVAIKQPDAFRDVTTMKNDGWFVPGVDKTSINGFVHSTNVILFTSHGMVQDFNRPSLAKAWLNPDFDVSAFDNPKQWRDLAIEFKLYRVIHDEASLSDLVDVERARDVKTAIKFRKLVQKQLGQDWSKVSQSQRYQIFAANGSKKMKKLKFHELCRIIGIGFTQDDLISVDFHADPFGINNSDDAMYISTHGRPYFVKPRDWWITQRARVMITTTEALVAQVARRIYETDKPPEIRVHRLDREEFTAHDSIRLRRDKRASKSKIDELVQDRLNDGMDFVITDMADVHSEQVSTHVSARGRNDLKNVNISTILTFLPKDEFCRLNVVAQAFDIDTVYSDFYRDRLNQAVGRNRGFRKDPATPYDHEIIVSPTLYRCLGGADFFALGRYPSFLTA